MPDMVLKEYGSAIVVRYPSMDYPQDLIDQIVMPALRRSYDKARRENWQMAKETTSNFELVRGPVVPANEEETEWKHYFGWYVAIQVPDEEEEEVALRNGS